MIRFVLVPSDMAGKPIAGALARTFPNDTVITQMMCESLITDYGSEEAEGVFMSFDGIVYDVKRRIEEEYAGEEVKCYILCGGSVIHAVLTLAACMRAGLDVELLVWERRRRRYVIYDVGGRRVDKEDLTVSEQETSIVFG